MIRENFMLNLGKKDITHMAVYEDEFSEKFSGLLIVKMFMPFMKN